MQPLLLVRNARLLGPMHIGRKRSNTARLRLFQFSSNIPGRGPNGGVVSKNSVKALESEALPGGISKTQPAQRITAPGKIKRPPRSIIQRWKDETHNKGPISWTSLFLCGIAAASATAYFQIERERRLEAAMKKIVSSGKPAIGGEWSLVDLDGNLVTNKNFEGKWLLLYFGFARCPDICPSEMMKVASVMDTMKEKHPNLYKDIVPVFVSVDPARDSLKALREYGEDFHPDYIFLTGAPLQVQEMAKKYRVYVSKADESEDGDYLVDHSIVVYFHDKQGDIADCFTQSMRPSDVVEKIIERMTFVPSF